MRKATDTSLRYLALLQLIPRQPKTLSVSQIGKKLRDINPEFDVDIRTIQRDLDKLSAAFPLTCERQGRATHWFWSDKSAIDPDI